ncbi:restriction endonuclease subunit S [Vagococcus fluvialis]|uniref:restriction endonuclease subunit S n=1 Tax=Vagococcus fluvialis TaxID=2738 RepID=UPI003B5BAE2F
MISSGSTPPTGQSIYYDNGTINWLNTGDLTDGLVTNIPKKISNEALLKFPTLKTYEPNSIVMAMYGATIAKLGIVMDYFTTNQACVVLSQPKESVYQKFIFYVLMSKRKDIINESRGGGQPNISQNIVKNIKLKLPKKHEQILIVSYIDSKLLELDNLISSKEKQIQLLEEQCQAMITEAVTKGLTPNINMKDSGIEWIGDIPEHWTTIKLKRVLKIHNGREVIAEVDEEADSIPVYGSGGIFKRTNEVLYSGNAILFGRKGTIGKPIKVTGEFWTVDTMYYSIVREHGAIDYLYYLLKIFPWSLIATNTTIPSVVGSELGEQIICYPNNIETIKQIGNYLEKKNKEIKKLVDDIYT